MTTTERYEAAEGQYNAASERLRVLEETPVFVRSDEEEVELRMLESRVADMREALADLAAERRKERIAIDVDGLVEAWQPLMEQKIAQYETLSQLIRQVWDQVAAIEGTHAEQEALLQALEDEVVRKVMINTFWIDSGTMRIRLANNIYPSMAWLDFLNNPVGYRVGPGSAIAANDPGCTEIPPRLIEKAQSGELSVPRAHRSLV